jgi:hypothetical protein
MGTRENVCVGGRWMKRFSLAHSVEFCISGDGLCVRLMWCWLAAFGRDPMHSKETIVLLQGSVAK